MDKENDGVKKEYQWNDVIVAKLQFAIQTSHYSQKRATTCQDRM